MKFLEVSGASVARNSNSIVPFAVSITATAVAGSICGFAEVIVEPVPARRARGAGAFFSLLCATQHKGGK